MKLYYYLMLIIFLATEQVWSQEHFNYNRSLSLEINSDTTANASFGDFDGDGHLDILLIKGRHWPIIDKISLGNGAGGIRNVSNLSDIADRSYTGLVADFNGDKFPDIAISNDAPDNKLVYFNDGKGNFTNKSKFGRPEWPTRNLSIADINNDGFPDLILANRGRPGKTINYICLNNGKGNFDSKFIAFAPFPASTIFPVDIDKDGFIDLVVPNRDGGQSYIYLGSKAMDYSEEQRIPFGRPDATIRMASATDFNNDGLIDIVSIDEKHGVEIYIGQKFNTFSSGISLTYSKSIPYSLITADINKDKKMDIIVGYISAPSTLFINEGVALKFSTISFGDSKGAVYGMAVGDFNEDGVVDIVAGRSDAPSMIYFGERTPILSNEK